MSTIYKCEVNLVKGGIAGQNSCGQYVNSWMIDLFVLGSQLYNTY